MHISSVHNFYISRIINNRLVQHIGYWVFLICFFGFFWGLYEHNYLRTFRNELIGLPVKLMVVYSLMYIFMPLFLYKKKYNLFVLFLFLSMLIGGIANHYLFKFLIYPFDEGIKQASGDYDLYSIMHRIIDINSVLVVPVTIKLFSRWYKENYTSQILEKQKLEAELNFLKGQIHPHFFFNTLNNLYSLIVKKSDDAGEVVLKLSDLMRYLLYEAKESEIALSKEIVNLKNYIALEKIRFGSRIDISFHTFGDISGQTIAPLMILPLLENCFKHSTGTDANHAWVTIEISAINNRIKVKIENSKTSKTANQKKNFAKGIGLANLRRRLELLYPAKHELKIKEYEESFLVSMKIINNEP